jgi:hypothetical protein
VEDEIMARPSQNFVRDFSGETGSEEWCVRAGGAGEREEPGYQA